MNSASKMHSRDGEDIISSLPDDTLVGILSFLDMKHAVQTTILSKRWTDLWTSLDCLAFDTQLFYSPTTNQYVGFQNFVDQVLIRRDSTSDIFRFILINYSQDCDIRNHFNTWILYAIRMKLKDLHIVVRGDGLGLPNGLFTSNSLTRLLLCMSAGVHERWITLPDSICLPNLQVLDIYSLVFHDENLTNKFFSSCPNLRELNMTNVEFLRMNVNLSCLELWTFTVDNLEYYCTWPDTKFKLHAPQLSYFSCKDYMSNEYILDIDSYVKVDFDMRVEEDDQNPGSYLKLPAEKKQMYAQRMRKCLKELLFVTDLKLSAWFLEVPSRSPDLLEADHIEFFVLSILRLETCLSSDSIRAIAYLFKVSLFIRSLFVEISQIKVGSSNIGPEAEVSLQCVLDELELVEIRGARRMC